MLESANYMLMESPSVLESTHSVQYNPFILLVAVSTLSYIFTRKDLIGTLSLITSLYKYNRLVPLFSNISLLLQTTPPLPQQPSLQTSLIVVIYITIFVLTDLRPRSNFILPLDASYCASYEWSIHFKYLS